MPQVGSAARVKQRGMLRCSACTHIGYTYKEIREDFEFADFDATILLPLFFAHNDNNDFVVTCVYCNIPMIEF